MSSVPENSRAVLVTGASTGIGEACALELDRQGYRVFAGVRAESAGQKLREAASARLVPVRLDVTDAASIADAARTVAEAVGAAGLWGLVNNAGIVVSGPLEVLPLDELRRQFEVNVIGPVAVTQAVLPLLRAARGRIVNVGSTNGAISPPFLGPYSASKHAMEALSDALRLELSAWGIAVVLVEPGPVNTPIWDKSLAAADTLASGVDPQRLGPYEPSLAAMRATIAQRAAEAIPVERVVRAVVDALGARRPKIRYFITWENRVMFKAFRMVPDRMRDWLVRRAIGLR